jgi:hypothetical protein
MWSAARLVEPFLLRAKANLDYIDELDVPEESLDGLAQESFSAILDRLDAADDFIVGALLAARPQIRGTDDEFQAAWDEAVAPYQRIQPGSRAGLRALLLDLVGHVPRRPLPAFGATISLLLKLRRDPHCIRTAGGLSASFNSFIGWETASSLPLLGSALCCDGSGG